LITNKDTKYYRSIVYALKSSLRP